MFDTLQVTNDLRKGGFSEPQAEAVVSAFSAISRDMMTRAELKEELERFATKEDLGRFATKADLENFATKADLADLESRLTWRMMMAAGFIVAAVGLLIKL